MKFFCENCETQIFETDRNCPNCGASIKNVLSNNIKSKSYIDPELKCIAYKDDGSRDIIFKGTTIIDSKIKLVENKNYKIELYPKVEMIISNVIWERKILRVGSAFPIIFDIEKVKWKNNISKHSLIKMIVPLAMVTKLRDNEISIEAKYYWDEKTPNNKSCYYFEEIENETI